MRVRSAKSREALGTSRFRTSKAVLFTLLLQQCQNVLGLCVGLCQYRDTRLLEDLGTGQVGRFLRKVSILNT